ncbi:hypothetical protein PIB30_025634 [Stylosanthes scabra]|uniref:Disease resistance protein Roq1-like winged-helix domain-containing protein n=1 Tax=Stylosanthes scabra TaxID=79078 RepID=A0ABU6UAJ0_9FABA|nr:hypothetical protein [Stylosanthes scabra]
MLDDVDELDQLKALCWSREWFGPGSRIIITTRDESLLRVLNVDHVSRMSEMDDDESVEHFCWHAFKQSSPKENFDELSKDVVAYSGGLPLALEVIGSVLFDKNVKEWESLLEKLKKIPNDKVQKKLRISFDSLNDDTVKEIFLDIAFFFIGMDRNDVVHILDEYDAEIGINVLVDRNLVTIDSNNRLGMHALLRDMGREIVREKSPKKLEKRSRLWLQKEVFEVLQTHTGTKAIEGLTLKLPRSNAICLETKAFNKMKRLRLLQLASVQLDGDFEHMSKDIRWVCWHGFPYKYIPSKFYQASLVAMELEFSSLRFMWKEAQEALGLGNILDIRVYVDINSGIVIMGVVIVLRWRGTKRGKERETGRIECDGGGGGVVMFLGMLKVLNLSHSYHLIQTPDFSYLPNLEKLLLKGCSSLSMISDTIGHLKRILLIDLEDCTSLPNLPRSFYELKSLITLIISGCSLIDKLEEDLAQMKSLKKLIADKTAITQVPFSIVRSKSIGYISLYGYEGFVRDVFPSLIWSWMSPTNNPSSLVQSFAGLETVSLDVLNLRRFWVECGTDLQLSGGVAKILDTLYATYYKELELTPTTSQASQISSSSLIDFHSQFRTFRSPNSLLIEVGKKTTVSNILREIILQISKSIGNIAFYDAEGLACNVIPSIIRPRMSLMLTVEGMWPFLVSVILPNGSFHDLSIISELLKLRSLRLECSSQIQINGDTAMDFFTTINSKGLGVVPTISQASNMNASEFLNCGSQDDISGSKNSSNFYLIQIGMNCAISMILRKSIFQKSGTCSGDHLLLPGDKNLEWLTFNGEGSSVTYEVSQMKGRYLKSVMLSIFYSSSAEITTPEILKSVSIITPTTNHVYEGDRLTSLEQKDWKKVISKIQAGNKVQVIVEVGHGFVVRKTTVYLIYDEPINHYKKQYQVKDIFSGCDDLVAIMNENVFGVDNKAADKNVSHLDCDKQVTQSRPAFTEVDISPTNKTQKWFEEDDTSSKKKRKISSSSLCFVKPAPEIKKFNSIKTFKPKSKGYIPPAQTSPIVVPSASFLNFQEESVNSGFKSTTRNQDQQLQKSPFVLMTEDAEAHGVKETNESVHLVNLPEDVDVLAELDNILLESYSLFPTKSASAVSGFKSQSLSVIDILHNIHQLFDNQVEVLVANVGIRKQFLDLLAQLDQMKSQIPTNLKPLVNDIKKFYEDALNYFPSIQEVFGNYQRLIDSKNQLQKKLETAKSRQAHFSASISKGKERINQMSKEVSDLEMKLKALCENRDKLESIVQLCEVETLKHQ